MKTAVGTRWRNAAGYEKFDCPIRAISVAMLSVAIVDYARLGMKRHRQWCRRGRDWKFSIAEKGPNYVPPIYQDVREKTEWIYSQQFGFIVDVLEMDLLNMQEFFLRLMSGPPPT